MENSQEKVLTTLKSMFKNYLMGFIWTNNSSYNKEKIINDFNNICQCFVDGGLITKYQNVINIANSDEKIIGDVSITDTYINFENLKQTYLITTILKGYLEVSMNEINEEEKPNDFSNRIQKELESLRPDERIEYIIEKNHFVRTMKNFYIKKQNFELAAQWRVLEKQTSDLLSKITPQSDEDNVIKMKKEK